MLNVIWSFMCKMRIFRKKECTKYYQIRKQIQVGFHGKRGKQNVTMVTSWLKTQKKSMLFTENSTHVDPYLPYV